MSNHAPPWLQSWLRSVLVGGIAVSTLGVASAGPFDVARFPIQRQTAPASSGEVSVETPAAPLRLNYQSAPWEKVLNDLAEQSQTTLVMKDSPPGRFSRRDGNQYSLSEAVRVLNHTLEKEGYRIIHQQDYLILIKLEDVRTRYERSPVPRATGVASTRETRNTNAPGVVYPRKFSTVTPVVDTRTEQTSGVVPAQHTVPEDLPSAAGKGAPRSRRIVRSTIATKQPAVDVARLIHNSFGKESQLVSSGPNGLPSFVVSRKSPIDQSSVELAIGIDVNQNQLVVEGPEKATDEVKQTIQLIQASVDRGEETVRVVPSTVDVTNLAKSLQPSMNRLLAIRAQQEAVDQQATQSNNPQELPEGGNPLGAELRSDVTVQAMPDLGVLILSGNERDVEAVMAVINEIEKLSVGTAPAIQLLLLEHVDATQLSTLLSSVYEDLTARQPGATTETPQAATDRSKVTFIPVTKPNALIILAPEADIPSILELARELDQPVDPLTEFEVFSLKSAIATQAAELVTNFFADRESLGGTLTAFADVRTNSLIVRARPRDLEEAAALILKIDRDASGAMNQLKVIPLKNAVASEVADVLNSAFQALQLPQGQTNQLGGAGAVSYTHLRAH
ncbi:MAG: hypothetical protein HUJ26_10690, partial [Planctomycetaceae bacterium]|nr:hypothetical protein [Planctomycetaceae bacterium]